MRSASVNRSLFCKLFNCLESILQTIQISHYLFGKGLTGEGNATEASNVTGRSRAIENCYLSQLSKMRALFPDMMRRFRIKNARHHTAD